MKYRETFVLKKGLYTRANPAVNLAGARPQTCSPRGTPTWANHNMWRRVYRIQHKSNSRDQFTTLLGGEVGEFSIRYQPQVI